RSPASRPVLSEYPRQAPLQNHPPFAVDRVPCVRLVGCRTGAGDSLAQALPPKSDMPQSVEGPRVVSTYVSYRLIARDIDRSLQKVGTQPAVARETKYYLDNISKVKSIDEFVSNTRLFKYAMKAFGLQDMDYAKAFMKKALEGGVKDADSFANKLSDKRYAE